MQKSVLILGSGGLRVGQAGEFDYSGSQAIKAFKDDGLRVVVLNPNIATVQTDESMADKVYFLPLQVEFVLQILNTEKIDILALSFGGQTALNLGLELYNLGIIEKYKLQILGSSITTINQTEDRGIFRQVLNDNNIKTTDSQEASTITQALTIANKLGYPLMIRSGFSLGGLGSGKINNETELLTKVGQALSGSPQIILEEYLVGWKEYEYEIIRDMYGNSLTICNMENLDPMGIHTGESIVVAPAQTLNNTEHQYLRNLSLKSADIFNIIGECNIQFAVNPENGDYRVIEMNPRLSRSSALASKATGYPLAYIAAKLCLGYPLYELQNQVTKETTAFFEPALDYIVVKIPRWDTHKLIKSERTIGTEMKSVGEVMAIGRSFPESLQKAVQMLNIGASALSDYPDTIDDLAYEIEFASDRRIFALFQWFYNGKSLSEAKSLSKIDHWFLSQIETTAKVAQSLNSNTLNAELLLQAKKFGFSDRSIAKLTNQSEEHIREVRIELNIKPVIKQIDTVAGEFAAATNYLYLTYHGKYHDITPTKEGVCIIGSGPYAIGSSVEFDWCTVNLARELIKQQQKVILINSNPETVSTDYDESDKLYFEPLTLERVLDILEFEQPDGVCVSVGGQIANNLALPLHKHGIKILGTSPNTIDLAENREKFSQLLTQIGVDQPQWINAHNYTEIKNFVATVGLPVIIRPSYVLSGSAMKVITDPINLENYIAKALKISKDCVISEFIPNAIEVEVDGVGQNGQIIAHAISEHIEYAGVHSGDATVVFPAQSLNLDTIARVETIAKKIVASLNLSGPFNLQLLYTGDQLKVIECNVRASRSFPFISKTAGINLIKIVAQVLLTKEQLSPVKLGSNNILGIKSPVFSYNRFKGADPIAQVEMSSTGEVAVLGQDFLSTFYLSWRAVGQMLKNNDILLNLDQMPSKNMLDNIQELTNLGFRVFIPEQSQKLFSKILPNLHIVGISKPRDIDGLTVESLISRQQIALVISIPNDPFTIEHDLAGFKLRRSAIDYHIPLVTNLRLAELLLQSLVSVTVKKQSLAEEKSCIA